ncbi:hypothetical protein CO660_05445 [Rhizobium sp. L9]|uniref:sugar phosphate isomerase/epimerase family protein n=1 Tax=Rhizobium sp. L9 TaxID=1340738 RepID=UPI000BE79097|nr:sugar phosphate isomerase/epimerase family protein [Rhizobium sp. L9]PDT30785.1 hypothetical protein CO660_05445 [Rhizobium sp. L9]
MKRSIATVTMTGTLPEKLRAASAAGFGGIELCEADIGEISLRDIASMAMDWGLQIDVLQPFRNFEGISSFQHERNLDQADRIFDRMNELGAARMLVCSNTQEQALRDDRLSASQLRDLAGKAAKHGLKVGFEALSWGTHICTFDHAYRIIAEADHPALGLVVDSFHTLALPFAWDTIAEIDGSRIAYVQIADAMKLDLPVIEWSRHHRCLPADGDLDVSGFLAAVLATGYRGPVSLEIFSDALKLLPAGEIARRGMRSLISLERQIETAFAPGDDMRVSAAG